MVLKYLIPIAAFLAVSVVLAVVIMTPVGADYYTNMKLEGRTSGTVGDTLTYTYSGSYCAGQAPPNVVCNPISSNVVNLVISTNQGKQLKMADHQLSITYQFTEAGQYIVDVWVTDHPETEQFLDVTIQSQANPTPSASSSPGGVTPSPTSSGGGILPVVQLPAVQVPALPGSAAGSSATSDSTWAWLIAIVVIILLAVIIVVLLLRRGGRYDEPYDERDYEHRRRRR